MRFPMFALVTLLAACEAEPTASDTPTDTDTPTQAGEFDEVHAVFQDRCGPCHTTNGSGGHNIGADDIEAAYDDSQLAATGGTVGDRSLARILDGSMPQGAGCTGDPAADAGNDACLDAQELAILEDWIDAGQPR